MPPRAENQLVRQLDELNRRLADNRARQTSLQKQLAAAKREVRRARLADGLCRVKRLLRRPAKSFELWPLGVMLVGPLLVAAILAVGVHALLDSFGYSAALFAIAVCLAAVGFAILLFVPNDVQLVEQSDIAATRLAIARNRADEITADFNATVRAILTDEQARDTTLRSRRHQQELLLEENWKALRGPDWETFLARAFDLLGGVINHTGAVGDQGVDLVVEFASNRFAIQTRGYVKSVSNDAVQQAVAGMAHYQCNRCAVITNSGFTAGAIALAKSNQCLLVGEEHIPALVLGEMPWFSPDS